MSNAPSLSLKKIAGKGTPVRLMWRDAKDVFRLQRQARHQLDLSSLVSASKIDLLGLFMDAHIAAEFAKDREEIASLQLPEMTGGVNLGDQRVIYYLARHFRPANILEVGTHIGCSTVHLAMAVRPFASSRITTVDIADVNDPKGQPWKKYDSHYSPAELTRMIGAGERVKFVVEDSVKYLRETSEKFDFIFLDGDHAGATVYQELPYALKALAPGGILLLHDYFPEAKPIWPGEYPIKGPYWAVERFRREGHAVKALTLGELPWFTKLNSRRSSLAILARG